MSPPPTIRLSAATIGTVLALVIASGSTGAMTSVAAPLQPAVGGPAQAAGVASVLPSVVEGPVARYKSFDLRGGYVAAGVGLRNRGSGTITLRGIPSGAKVKAAYLYWSILGGDKPQAGFKKVSFAGRSVTGTLIGSGASTGWSGAPTGYAYRATVTRYVKKNGRFKVAKVASGVKNGSDPFETAVVPPLAQGASLVVVYSRSSYPRTTVVISDGYAPGGGSLTVPFGLVASNPVGQVRTTFIVGDGQSLAEPPATVNGIPLPGGFDGADPASVPAAKGNLWDTRTVDLPNVVKPGDVSAQVTVSQGPDSLAWIAQVFSIGRYGARDTDGDSLLDGWEANGYDANGDGVIDMNLPAMGADPLRKDLFVEMDYMSDALLAGEADLDRIVQVFAAAPSVRNPNGKAGINLHLDAGAARGAKYNLGGGNNVSFVYDLNPVLPGFLAIKNTNFNPARAKIFYYMIWANGHDGGTVAGNAFSIPSDSFLVSLGRWPQAGTGDQRVATFMHQLGHALGLRHGGGDDVRHKPNYLSVMNPAFESTGVPRTGSRPAYFGYSGFTLPSLNEKRLNEKKGLKSSKASTYRTRWYCGDSLRTTTRGANKPIDWNCDGRKSSSVRADVDGSGGLSTVKGYNDWAHLRYGGGAVGGGAASPGG